MSSHSHQAVTLPLVPLSHGYFSFSHVERDGGMRPHQVSASFKVPKLPSFSLLTQLGMEARSFYRARSDNSSHYIKLEVGFIIPFNQFFAYYGLFFTLAKGLDIHQAGSCLFH